MSKVINEVPVESIPEVAAFEEAKTQLEAFRVHNKPFFEVLDALVQQYNAALSAAEKEVRSLKCSSGDFVYYQNTTKVDGDLLCSRIGLAEFLAIGGTVEEKRTYKIKPADVARAVNAGRIVAHVQEECVTSSATYHVPKPVVL